MRSTTSDYSLLKLLAFSALAGLLTVGYILIIVKMEESRKRVDPIETAAQVAAEEITKVTVGNSRFGLIGLCDTSLQDDSSYAVEPTRVRSLNSINASIKTAAVFAQSRKSKTMIALVDEDLEVLEGLKQSLQKNLEASVSAEPQTGDEENRVYKRVYKHLKQSLPSNTIIAELKLTLGVYGKSSARATFVKSLPLESRESYVENGFYRDNISVPVTDRHQVSFYKIYDENRIVPSDKFMLGSEGMLPGAVLLELSLKHRYSDSLETKSACALIGTEPDSPSPTCLTLRFPQGVPAKINSLNQFLFAKNWRNEGVWAQAGIGDVPGEGHLSPTIDPVLSSMRPEEAVAGGLYNWLKEITPPPAPHVIEAAVNVDFLKGLPASDVPQSVNSCLAIDTGARQRAFLNATMPGNSGQRALANCFEYPDNFLAFPNSALPVVVDKFGNAALAGRENFDQSLVQSYLDSIFSTNLAAIETMATARTLARRYQKELKDSTLSPARKVELANLIKLARRAGKNGLKVAEKSFDISNRNFNLLRNGLHKIDSPPGGYLLSRQLTFIPAPKPLTEEDLETSSNSNTSIWLSEKAEILMPWKERFKSIGGITVEGKPLDMVLAQKLSNRSTGPLTVIYDSRDLKTGGEIIPHISRTYPFAARPLPRGQSLYYCPEALETGSKPRVVWSLLIRNNSFHKNIQRSGSRYQYRNHQWCQDFEPPFSSCPRPSLEIQLRRPLPVVEDIPRSTLVMDPGYDRKVPVVPPLPAEMM